MGYLSKTCHKLLRELLKKFHFETLKTKAMDFYTIFEMNQLEKLATQSQKPLTLLYYMKKIVPFHLFRTAVSVKKTVDLILFRYQYGLIKSAA